MLSYLVMLMCTPVFSFSYLKVGTLSPATLRIKRERGVDASLADIQKPFFSFNVTNVYKDIFLTPYFHSTTCMPARLLLAIYER